MTQAGSYILTVTAAAILAAVVTSLSGQGPMRDLIRLLAGLFMAVTVLSPLLKLEIPDPQAWFSDFGAEGLSAAEEGQRMAKEAEQAIIKEQLEAYILDKAQQYGAALAVDVTLDEDGVPVGVVLTGDVSPDAKMGLVRIMETELGLGEEAQQWSS